MENALAPLRLHAKSSFLTRLDGLWVSLNLNTKTAAFVLFGNAPEAFLTTLCSVGGFAVLGWFFIFILLNWVLRSDNMWQVYLIVL